MSENEIVGGKGHDSSHLNNKKEKANIRTNAARSSQLTSSNRGFNSGFRKKKSATPFAHVTSTGRPTTANTNQGSPRWSLTTMKRPVRASSLLAAVHALSMKPSWYPC